MGDEFRVEPPELRGYSSMMERAAGHFYRLAVAISSKGPLRTRMALRQVPDEALDQEVDGHVTELDELPATVRDVLFCEIC